MVGTNISISNSPFHAMDLISDLAAMTIMLNFHSNYAMSTHAQFTFVGCMRFYALCVMRALPV